MVDPTGLNCQTRPYVSNNLDQFLVYESSLLHYNDFHSSYATPDARLTDQNDRKVYLVFICRTALMFCLLMVKKPGKAESFSNHSRVSARHIEVYPILQNSIVSVSQVSANHPAEDTRR